MISDKVESFEIIRSYSKKVQEKQYEPADYFASYKAIIKADATEEEIQAISDDLAERAENDVLGKVDPQRMIRRQQTMAELRTKITQLIKKVQDLEYQIANHVPFK